MKIQISSLFAIGGKNWRIRRNSAASLADTLLTILTYFLVMRQVVLTLGLEQAGLWSLILGYLTFLRILDQGGAASVSRFVAAAMENPEEQAGFADSAVWFSFTFFSVIAVIGFIPIDWLLQGSVDPALKHQTRHLLLGLLLILPMQMVALGQLAVLDGIGRADLRGAINGSATLVYAIVALALLPSHGIKALVYAQTAQSLIGMLAARVILAIKSPSISWFPAEFGIVYVQRLMGFGARLQIATIPMSLFDAFNRILIGRFSGLELLGLYDLAYKFAASARQVVQASLAPILPEFSRLLASNAEAAHRHYSVIAPMAVIAAAGVSMVQLIASPLVSYLMLKRIDGNFLLVTTALSLAWGLANLGLTSQMYARAAGVLRWAMLGQWLLLASGTTLVLLVGSTVGGIWVLMAPSIAIAAGHLVTLAGEVRQFELNTLRSALAPAALASLAIVILTSSVSIAGILLSSA
jgi:O-antigen/teichoic acid export membrane protein